MCFCVLKNAFWKGPTAEGSTYPTGIENKAPTCGNWVHDWSVGIKSKGYYYLLIGKVAANQQCDFGKVAYHCQTPTDIFMVAS